MFLKSHFSEFPKAFHTFANRGYIIVNYLARCLLIFHIFRLCVTGFRTSGCVKRYHILFTLSRRFKFLAFTVIKWEATTSTNHEFWFVPCRLPAFPPLIRIERNCTVVPVLVRAAVRHRDGAVCATCALDIPTGETFKIEGRGHNINKKPYLQRRALAPCRLGYQGQEAASSTARSSMSQEGGEAPCIRTW